MILIRHIASGLRGVFRLRRYWNNRQKIIFIIVHIATHYKKIKLIGQGGLPPKNTPAANRCFLERMSIAIQVHPYSRESATIP
jgi:hypothetical protein